MRGNVNSSLGDILDRYKGIGPGFDFLRVSLAIIIVMFHTLTVTDHYYRNGSMDDTPFWIVHYSLVPMFFALSGFLISASAGRLTLKNFLFNRSIRIVPALAVDTLFCTLIVGPIFTVLPLAAYFSRTAFFAYFLNIFGWIHFDLPGVFTTLPTSRVNGALWTIPFELACYFLISVLMVIGAMKKRYFVFGGVLAYLALATIIEMTGVISLIPQEAIRKIISVAFIEHEAQAVTAFAFGIVIYQQRYAIPYSKFLFGVLVAILFLAAATLTFSQGQAAVARFVFIPALVYITVFIGLTPMPLPRYFKTGDYSYGIYLYHQPFLQMAISLFPAFALRPYTGPAFVGVVAAPFILGIAWLSWHLVEAPLLALRKRFSLAARIRAQNAEQAFASAKSESVESLSAQHTLSSLRK